MCLKSEKKLSKTTHFTHNLLVKAPIHELRLPEVPTETRNPSAEKRSPSWDRIIILTNKKKVVKWEKTGVHGNYLRDARGENVPLARFR